MSIETNTPIGTGLSEDQAVQAISSILESETTETNHDDVVVETETELPETHTPVEVTEEDEQPLVDSETYDETAEVETNELQVETPKIDPSEILFEHDGQKITREEAQKGYLRQSDYTRKTQELTRLRSEVEADKSSFGAAIAERNLATLKQFKQEMVLHLAMQTPDWDKLHAEDPYAYAEAKHQFEQKQLIANNYWNQITAAEQQERAKVEAERARQEQLDIEHDNANTIAAREYMVANHEEFKNPDTAKFRTNSMIQMLRDDGFSDKEIADVKHPKVLEYIYYTNKYKEMMAKEAAIKQNAAKVKASLVPQTKPVVPKPTSNAGRPTNLSVLQKNFTANPSDTDAAAALIQKLL